MKLALLTILMPWPIALLLIVPMHLAGKAWKWYWKEFIPATAVRKAGPCAYCFRGEVTSCSGCEVKGR